MKKLHRREPAVAFYLKMKIKIEDVLQAEEFALSALFLFVFINWLRLTGVTDLAPPDFYTYYFESGRLFSGEFLSQIITPLYPLLLGILGHFFSLFTSSGSDPFILAGSSISLLSGCGIIYYAYRLLKAASQRLALPGAILLVISPLFLKFLALPLTDMLYLLFVMMSFYYFFKSRVEWSLLAVSLGVLARFEGILLFFSGIINFTRLKSRKLLLVIILTLIALCDLFFLFTRYAPRILNFLGTFFSQQSYLFFFKNPERTTNILYGNILYFVPYKFPSILKWALLYFCLFLFVVGIYKMFRQRWQFTLSILFYLLFFLFAKGYVVDVGMRRLHERRLLSFLVLFFIVSFWGLCYLLKFIKNHLKSRPFLAVKVTLLLFMLSIILCLPFATWEIFLTLALLAPLLYRAFKGSRLPVAEAVIFAVVVFVLFGSFYFKSYKQASRFVKAGPNKAGYAIARWINDHPQMEKEKTAVFSSFEMVEYYLDREVDLVEPLVRNKRRNEDEKGYWREIFGRFKRNRIQYVIFDRYMKGKFNRREKTIKEMLHQAHKEKTYFRVIKNLAHKGNYVGVVMRPLYDRFINLQNSR